MTKISHVAAPNVSATSNTFSRRDAIILSILVGFAVSLISYYVSSLIGHAGDFSWPLNAARLLLQGENPYHRIDLGPKEFPADVLLYPLPALVLVMPFTIFPDPVALGLFHGLSAGLLAYGICTKAPHLLPIFISAPFWMCICYAQWSVLLTAFLLLPALNPLIVVKPTHLISAFAFQSQPKNIIRIVIGIAVTCILTWPLLWSWPLDWLQNLPKAHYTRQIVAFSFPGCLVLIALLRWRESSARLLVAMALSPHFPIYDYVAIGLVPHNFKRSMIFAIGSWFIATIGAFTLDPYRVTVVYYLFAFVLLMTAPKVIQQK